MTNDQNYFTVGVVCNPGYCKDDIIEALTKITKTVSESSPRTQTLFFSALADAEADLCLEISQHKLGGWQFILANNQVVTELPSPLSEALRISASTNKMPLGYCHSARDNAPSEIQVKQSPCSATVPMKITSEIASLSDLVIIALDNTDSTAAKSAAIVVLEQRVPCVAVGRKEEVPYKMWLSHLSIEEFEKIGFTGSLPPINDRTGIRGDSKVSESVDDIIERRIRETLHSDEAEQVFKTESPYSSRPAILRTISSIWERYIEKPSKYPPVCDPPQKKAASISNSDHSNMSNLRTPSEEEERELAELVELRGELSRSPVDSPSDSGHRISLAFRSVNKWLFSNILPSRSATRIIRLFFWHSIVENLPFRSKLQRAVKGKQPHEQSGLHSVSPITKIYQHTKTYRNPISQLASYYQGLHRFAVLSIPLLTLVSALCAATIPVIENLGKSSSQPTAPPNTPANTKTPVPTSQQSNANATTSKYMRGVAVSCVVMAVLIHLVHSNSRWQSRAFNYRLVSERLRHALIQLLLDQNPGIPTTLPAHYGSKDSRHTWVDGQFRQALRQLKLQLADAGIPIERLYESFRNDKTFQRECREMLLNEWLKPQIDWHRKTALGYTRLAIMIEALARWIGVTSILFGIISILSGFFGASLAKSPLLELLVIAFAACVAALQYVSTHAEFSRMADRYAEMRKVLTRSYWDIIRTEDLPENIATEILVQKTNQALKIALDEAIEWRLQFSYRPLKNPV